MWMQLLHPASDDNGVADSILKLTAVMLCGGRSSSLVLPLVLAAACLALVPTASGGRRSRGDPRGAPWRPGSAGRPLSDNHIYLLAYWCLAIGLALAGPGPAATLAASSRWLLGAAFAMAVVWKALLSVDYIDGRFFRVTLLTDERFADASLVFGGLTPDQMAQNRKFLEPLPEGAELLDPPPFVEPIRLRVFAAVATWGGLALETLVALLCRAPPAELPRSLDTWRWCCSASQRMRWRRWPGSDG